MDPVAFEHEIELNRVAFESMREQIRRSYPGQYVAFARGQVLAAAPSYEEALAAIERLSPVPECYFVFEAEDGPIFDVVTDY